MIILSIFIFSCSTLQNEYSFDDALEFGIQKIGGDLPTDSDVAILDFKSENVKLSSYITEEVYDKLINGRKFRIMERSRTDAISQEIGYENGEIDIWDAAKGKEIVNFISFGDDFVSLTPDGYYLASEDGEQYITVMANDNITTISDLHNEYNKPKRIEEILSQYFK